MRIQLESALFLLVPIPYLIILSLEILLLFFLKDIILLSFNKTNRLLAAWQSLLIFIILRPSALSPYLSIGLPLSSLTQTFYNSRYRLLFQVYI